ncbi:FHA domain-containing protein [Planctomyces sp. SH-PL62]|uniref:FHA domain-containing protein n=1 Tax=Planctomyces sp. SH-PL62 TaxID=1636152 RepID=UPI00078EDE7E|nr:FHA domain-containing protein [Planctomyces sp. SH-PL62]AMV38874.1 FHA domain-containing protein FhaB [Planctomyces sp. SH-PL62]
MSSTLTIGSNFECDLAIGVPSVSGRHCRLTREGPTIFLEDLGSRNGTYLNGNRIVGDARAVIAATDVVHLGSHLLDLDAALARLPLDEAPPPTTLTFRGREMVIGRTAGCDLVVDLPMISMRHARLYRSGADVLIEDLGSSNGTFVDGRRIEGAAVVPPGRLIGLGSASIRLDEGSWTWDRAEPAPSVPEAGAGRGAIRPETAVAVVLALVAAPLVVTTLVAASAAGGATRIFGLALAAPALGFLDAAVVSSLAVALGRRGVGASRSPGRSVAVAAIGVVQCLTLWLLGRWLGDLNGAGASALLVLALAAFVGAAAGFVVVAYVPGAPVVWVVTSAAWILTIGLLGGFAPELPTSLRPATALSPTRWAFEGLLTLASRGRHAAGEPGADLVERYFPADSDRMGLPAACAAMALAAVGLAAVAAGRPLVVRGGAAPAGTAFFSG